MPQVLAGRPDAKFLRGFRALILKRVRRGDRFIIITGGGKVCRLYQEALRRTAPAAAEDLDWMGIYATRFNAQLVRLMFGKLAHPRVVEDSNKKASFKEKILVAGGWVPGRSTDDDAVRLAKIYGARTIINLSNVDFVYTKDPRKFRSARPIKKISWAEFRKIVGSKWDPGLNAPFDPVAARFAQRHGLKVIIARGSNLTNLQNLLELNKQDIKGTVIR